MDAVDKPKDRRLDLDGMDQRLKEAEREELTKLGLDPDAPRGLVKTEDPTAEVVRLREENEKMHAMISRAIDGRNKAREFMTIWSDPRRYPELVQEVYASHPGIALVRAEINEETAQRSARLISHLAVTYEINPLISGMIYAWPDKGKACVEMGYRAYQEMIERRPELDIDGPREMTPEQRTLHGLGPEDRGSICYVWDWGKKRRFESNGARYAPTAGIGVWRKNGLHGKPDNIANGRSGQWQSEKNAIKDTARRALSFAIVQTANFPDVIDLTYDQETDMWALPAQVALWLSKPENVMRFETFLAEHNVTDEEFNAFLGHNWLYTQLSPEEIRAKADEYLKARSAIIVIDQQPAAVVVDMTTGEVTPQPAPESSPDTALSGLVSDSSPVQQESTTPEPTAAEILNEVFGPKDTGEAVTPEVPNSVDPDDTKFVKWNTAAAKAWVMQTFADLSDNEGHAYNAIKEAFGWSSWKDAPADLTTGQFKIEFAQKRAAVVAAKTAAPA